MDGIKLLIKQLFSFLDINNDFCCFFQGIENVSDYAISFHYMGPAKMYTMEYFVYHLRPYGIISRTQTLNLDKGRQ